MPSTSQVDGFPQSPLITQGFVAWDIVAALHVTHPALFSHQRWLTNLHIAANGTMAYAPWPSAQPRHNHSNVASYMARADAERVLSMALELIYTCPAARSPTPPARIPWMLQLGLIPEFLTLALMLFLFVLKPCCWRCRGLIDKIHTLMIKRHTPYASTPPDPSSFRPAPSPSPSSLPYTAGAVVQRRVDSSKGSLRNKAL